MGGKWPNSYCFLGCSLQDLFKTAGSILVLFSTGRWKVLKSVKKTIFFLFLLGEEGKKIFEKFGDKCVALKAESVKYIYIYVCVCVCVYYSILLNWSLGIIPSGQ